MTVYFVLAALMILMSGPAEFISPDPAEVSAVRERLAPLQLLSFATRLEYCGYLGQLPDGSIAFTEIQRGGHDGCTPVLTQDGMRLVASLHTHGAYGATVPAEFPTVLDMNSDRSEGVNGYVSTPGGRLWYIDSRARLAVQLCGLGCLPQDPQFQPGDDGVIDQSYSYLDLVLLEASAP